MRRAIALLLLAAPAPALASPTYFFGMGPFVRRAPSELTNLTVLPAGTMAARTASSEQLYEHDLGVGWQAGLLFGPVYTAIDVGGGSTGLPNGPHMAAGFRVASAATLLAVAGLRTTMHHHTAFRVELAGGMRHATYCIGDSLEDHEAYTASHGVAEIRVRGEQRIHPWMLFGATLGTSLIASGAWVGSIDITFPIVLR